MKRVTVVSVTADFGGNAREGTKVEHQQLTRHNVMTTEADADRARHVLDTLAGEHGILTVERDGQRVSSLPPELGRILQQVLEAVGRGGTITVGAIPEELTTTTAAEILDVSRPTLMKMIRAGEIPAHLVGTHHRLKAEDVFARLRQRRAREREALQALLEAEGDEL